jgi:hypothetical protein
MSGNAIGNTNSVNSNIGINAGFFARTGTPANDPVTMLAQMAATGSPAQQGEALRALDAMTGSRSASNALARGEAPAPAAGRTATAEVCTVEVRYRPVGPDPVDIGPIRLGVNHAFIVTTDNDSVRYFRGGPQANNTGLNSPNSGSSSGSNDPQEPAFDPQYGIYGPIVTESGLYRPGTVDWTTSPTGRQVVDRIPGNCNRIEGEFRRHINDIEAAGINYTPLYQNSNSTVRETLERAGYPNVRPVVSAPAWSTQLP